MASGSERSRRRRRAGLLISVVATVAEAAALRRRGYGLAGDVAVRCRDGHLFSTIWVPGVSFKAARLGLWRFQRCPVGRHWALVTPAPAGERVAGLPHDLRIP